MTPAYSNAPDTGSERFPNSLPEAERKRNYWFWYWIKIFARTNVQMHILGFFLRSF